MSLLSKLRNVLGFHYWYFRFLWQNPEHVVRLVKYRVKLPCHVVCIVKCAYCNFIVVLWSVNVSTKVLIEVNKHVWLPSVYINTFSIYTSYTCLVAWSSAIRVCKGQNPCINIHTLVAICFSVNTENNDAFTSGVEVLAIYYCAVALGNFPKWKGWFNWLSQRGYWMGQLISKSWKGH